MGVFCNAEAKLLKLFVELFSLGNQIVLPYVQNIYNTYSWIFFLNL